MLWWILIILILAAFIWLLEALFRFAIVRKKPKPGKKSMSSSKGLVHLDPYKEQMKAGEEWIRARQMETVSIQSHDGLKLVGHYLNAGARKTLILFHGYRSRAYRDFSCVAEYYHSLGFNLLFVDQRAHGESEGKHICFGALERLDCVRWAEYIDRRVGGDIFLDGISMGASTVLMAAGEQLPDSVRGIIADCGFTSPGAIMEKVMTVDLKIPKWPLFQLVSLFIRLRAGFGVEEYSTLKALEKNRLPILFLHGKDDRFVPCSMTEQAYAACSSEKEMLLVEGAGHGVSYLVDRQSCQQALERFLAKYSREA